MQEEHAKEEEGHMFRLGVPVSRVTVFFYERLEDEKEKNMRMMMMMVMMAMNSRRR